MVLDHYVCQKAFEGDIDAVKAWLAADPSRDVTDIFEDGEGYTTMVNLLCLSAAGQATPAKVALTRWLLAQGVDPCHYVFGSNAGDRAAATGDRTAPLRSCANSATTESCGRSSSSGKRRGKWRGE